MLFVFIDELTERESNDIDIEILQYKFYDLIKHTYTETTALASHPCPYRIQNIPSHVSHPFWNLSIIHVIHGYAMLWFQVRRTPIIHEWRSCCNSHKSEVSHSCFLAGYILRKV